VCHDFYNKSNASGLICYSVKVPLGVASASLKIVDEVAFLVKLKLFFKKKIGERAFSLVNTWFHHDSWKHIMDGFKLKASPKKVVWHSFI